MPDSKKRLTSFVHVKNPKTDLYEVFGPDDDLPAWAEKELSPQHFGEAELIPQPGSSQPSDDVPEDERPQAKSPDNPKSAKDAEKKS